MRQNDDGNSAFRTYTPVHECRAMHDDLTDLRDAIMSGCAPERIVLFGSRGRGDHRPDSDYDVLLVVADDQPLDACERTIRDALRVFPRHVDLTLRSASAFERRKTDVGTLDYAAATDGRTLCERPSPRVPRRVQERPSSPESVAEWIARAESDCRAMSMTSADPHLTDVTTLHAHQCAEAAIRAAADVRAAVRVSTNM